VARAREHFVATLGSVPASVDVLARYAPGALDGYLAFREYAHRTPPEGHLDAATRELLFVALDVAVGHVDAAKAHAAAAIEAGASVEAITQALVITMMVSGIHTWSQHGHDVVTHAVAMADEKHRRAARGATER
jgi:alkylhydroperoxidase/carboxymuconolactone decarboxylase family protein YurZ